MKKIVKAKKSTENLGDHCACYVLISCSSPNASGEMEVNMEYQGDETLASFLIENAAQVFDTQWKQRESQ